MTTTSNWSIVIDAINIQLDNLFRKPSLLYPTKSGDGEMNWRVPSHIYNHETISLLYSYVMRGCNPKKDKHKSNKFDLSGLTHMYLPTFCFNHWSWWCHIERLTSPLKKIHHLIQQHNIQQMLFFYWLKEKIDIENVTPYLA